MSQLGREHEFVDMRSLTNHITNYSDRVPMELRTAGRSVFLRYKMPSCLRQYGKSGVLHLFTSLRARALNGFRFYFGTNDSLLSSIDLPMDQAQHYFPLSARRKIYLLNLKALIKRHSSPMPSPDSLKVNYGPGLEEALHRTLQQSGDRTWGRRMSSSSNHAD